MAGLEYRRTLAGAVPTPALDLPCDATYWGTAKPNDPVTINASGEVVRAAITAAPQGVLAAKEYMMEKETPRIVKVYLDKNAVYEVKIAAGTPVVGGEYELDADGNMDASKSTNKAVRVLKIYPEGTALVRLV